MIDSAHCKALVPASAQRLLSLDIGTTLAVDVAQGLIGARRGRLAAAWCSAAAFISRPTKRRVFSSSGTAKPGIRAVYI